MKKLLLSAALLLGTIAANALPVQHSVGAVAGSLNGFEYKAYFQNKMVVAASLGVRASQSQGLAWTRMYTNKDAQDYHESHGETMVDNNNMKFVYWDVEMAANLGYQDNFKVLSAGTFSWFVGGGLNVGAIQIKEFGKYDGKYISNYKTLEPVKTPGDAWKAIADERELYGDLPKDVRKYELCPVGFKVGMNAYAGVEFKFRNLPLIVGMDFRPGVGVGITMCDDKTIDGEGMGIYEGSRVELNGFFDWALNATVRYYF